MRGLAAVDLARFGIEKFRLEVAIERMRQVRGIGDDAVAHAEGALGRLDQAVHVLEAFAARHAQALEQRQDHQRGEALRGRRRVEGGAAIERDREWLGGGGAAAFEIVARHRTADALQVRGDLASDVAAVEIIEPGMGEMV
jgi:hypothetical protein